MKCAIIPVTPFQQNSTLVWNEETMVGASIDPGGDIDHILSARDEVGMTIEKIFLTHGHLDHASGTMDLAERLGVPVEGPHEEDAFLLDALPAQAAKYGFPEAAAVKPDRWLKGGDTVEAGGLTFNVRHCPGHTPGHVVFFHEPSRFAVVGDVLFQGSIGRTDLPRGDHATLLQSIREQLWPLGEDVVFVPGHGPTSTFGNERKTNPFVGDALFQ
ncbi:MAG: MBL fold metallo-hydrolase [Rhodospirillaceae bacterium]|nr:MBL fold metallo-hydrolase [Rhodospirillaceae bacterium]